MIMTDKVKKQNEELERLLADPSTPADVLIATDFDSYTDAESSAENQTPDANLYDLMAFKKMKFKKLSYVRASSTDNTYVLQGRYKQGMIKHNVRNDSDVKTWTDIDTNGETNIPSLNDMLNIQENCVVDAYSAGMFNGIEAVAATIEKREPEYKDCPRVPLGERLLLVLNQAREEKEQMERGDTARYQAIVVTELEKLFAFHSVC